MVVPLHFSLIMKKISGKVFGDPTEIALVVFSHKFGYTKEKIAEKFEFVMEQPFDAVVTYDSYL